MLPNIAFWEFGVANSVNPEFRGYRGDTLIPLMVHIKSITYRLKTSWFIASKQFLQALFSLLVALVARVHRGRCKAAAMGAKRPS